MSKKIIWKVNKYYEDGGVTFEEAVFTLSQARKACKECIFYFPDAVRAATALQLPNWEKALGKVVAHAHYRAKKYYEDEKVYLHNQKALEDGRLEDIDLAATRAAVDAWADDAVVTVWVAGAAATGWAAAAWVARAAVGDADAAEVAEWAAARAAGAAWIAVDDVNDLIDIYFDVLEEA